MTKRKFSLKKDPVDLRDKVYRSAAFAHPSELPQEVDLRGSLYMPPVVDQGQLGSCTANAIVSGLRQYLELKKGGTYTDLSRLYLYWHERSLEGTVSEDSGAYIRDGMKVLSSLGVCPEADFPYDIAKFKQKPTADAETHAAQYKITEYHRILDLNGLKAALAEGLPVVIGMTVYQSFESQAVAETGIVPTPKKSRESVLGGHALLVVGYKNIGRKQYLIVRNSWGEEWGDKGYCYIPTSFVKSGIINDMWTGQ